VRRHKVELMKHKNWFLEDIATSNTLSAFNDDRNYTTPIRTPIRTCANVCDEITHFPIFIIYIYTYIFFMSVSFCLRIEKIDFGCFICLL